MLDLKGINKLRSRPKANSVLRELVGNSIDSFLLIEEDSRPDSMQLSLCIESISGFLEEKPDVSLTIEDNGVGFGEKERAAFVTPNTSYKDGFSQAGLEFAKGTGRFQYFKAFERVSILSRPREGSETFSTTFSTRVGYLDEDDFKRRAASDEEFGTKLTLSEVSDEFLASFQSLISQDESLEDGAEKLKLEILKLFHLRLLLVKSSVQDFEIKIKLISQSDEAEALITPRDIPEPSVVKNVKITSGEKEYLFKLSHFPFQKIDRLTRKNEAWLVARNSPVLEVSTSVLGSEAAEKQAINGAFHLFLLEGSVLDITVTDERNAFKLPENSSELNFSDHAITLDLIKERLHWAITEIVDIPQWTKEETVEEAYSKFGVTAEALNRFKINVQTGESGRKLAQRVLKKAQESIVEDTENLVEMSEALKILEPETSDYEEKLDKLVALYVDSFEPLALSGLAQLTTRRAAVVDILQDYVDRASEEDVSESVFHSILFPKGATSQQHVRHDLWLLGEEFYTFRHVSSDKALSTYRTKEGKPVFDPSIDMKINDLNTKYSRDESALRPDVAVFVDDESAIIVELKKPSVELNSAVQEMMEYASVLAEFNLVGLKRFYGVGLGGYINRRIAPGTEFADGSGYYGFEDLRPAEGGERIGTLSWEIYPYGVVAKRAGRRIKAYRDQLGI